MIKSWSIWQEGDSTPIFMRASSIRLRDNGYTIVKDGVEIPQTKRAVKVEVLHDKQYEKSDEIARKHGWDS